MPRGGKREGAGRKKEEVTKRISVPETLVPVVQNLIKKYRSGEHQFPILPLNKFMSKK